MLLAERLRTADERAVVLSVLERVMRVTLDMDAVYAEDATQAQTALQQRLAEEPDHEFTVRSLPSPFFCGSTRLGSALARLFASKWYVLQCSEGDANLWFRTTMWKHPSTKCRNHRV